MILTKNDPILYDLSQNVIDDIFKKISNTKFIQTRVAYDTQIKRKCIYYDCHFSNDTVVTIEVVNINFVKLSGEGFTIDNIVGEKKLEVQCNRVADILKKYNYSIAKEQLKCYQENY